MNCQRQQCSIYRHITPVSGNKPSSQNQNEVTTPVGARRLSWPNHAVQVSDLFRFKLDCVNIKTAMSPPFYYEITAPRKLQTTLYSVYGGVGLSVS